jgi:Tol biopolymer transport system component
MKQVLPGLLPYALASTAVVLVSAIAIGTTVRPGGIGPGPSAATAEPTAAARPATFADTRMAYWRSAANGILELWVSDLDGDHRSRIATAGADSEISLTRWSPDGSALAYTIAGATLGLAWLDGTSATLPIPSQLRSLRWRIVSFEWATDATRIAVTLRAGGGLSNESDVYVAEARGSATFERATTMGDAFAGRWIDADRLFVETASGMIAVLDLGTKAIRPITGMPATSPMIGRDGRVYFSGGRFVSGDVMSQPVASGWVWSATIDGDDLRRETGAEQAQARLFGVLADGRAVTGVPGGVYFAADGLVPLAFVGAGTVRRVVVSDDGRRVLGITDQRILQIDIAKIPRSLGPGSLPPPSAATTLLSGIRDADVWASRKAVALARAPQTAGGPKAKLAFILGRALWQMDPDGAVRMLLAEPTGFLAPPKWSPSGDRIATYVMPPTFTAPATAVVIGSAGPTQRWPVPPNHSGMQWSPDGSALAFFAASAAPRFDEWTTRTYDAATGRAGETIAGRAFWAAAGRLVLSDGEPGDPVTSNSIRVGQRIDLVSGSGTRTITDARRLAASPLLRELPDPALPPYISQLFPSGEPALIGVMLARTRQGGTTSNAFVVVRVSDGEPVYALSITDPRQPVQLQSGPLGLAWSPVGHLLGWDVAENTGAGGTVQRRTVVVDPLGSRTLIREEGRFAGWSPDGAWVYVARDGGLYAYPLDGGDPVRVAPYGVAVAATTP